MEVTATAARSADERTSARPSPSSMRSGGAAGKTGPTSSAMSNPRLLVRGRRATSAGRPYARGMADLTIWHNQRCSKSRSARDILEEAGIEFEERKYLDAPPTAAELDEVL